MDHELRFVMEKEQSTLLNTPVQKKIPTIATNKFLSKSLWAYFFLSVTAGACISSLKPIRKYVFGRRARPKGVKKQANGGVAQDEPMVEKHRSGRSSSAQRAAKPQGMLAAMRKSVDTSNEHAKWDAMGASGEPGSMLVRTSEFATQDTMQSVGKENLFVAGKATVRSISAVEGLKGGSCSVAIGDRVVLADLVNKSTGLLSECQPHSLSYDESLSSFGAENTVTGKDAHEHMDFISKKISSASLKQCQPGIHQELGLVKADAAVVVEGMLFVDPGSASVTETHMVMPEVVMTPDLPAIDSSKPAQVLSGTTLETKDELASDANGGVDLEGLKAEKSELEKARLEFLDLSRQVSMLQDLGCHECLQDLESEKRGLLDAQRACVALQQEVDALTACKFDVQLCEMEAEKSMLEKLKTEYEELTAEVQILVSGGFSEKLQDLQAEKLRLLTAEEAVAAQQQEVEQYSARGLYEELDALKLKKQELEAVSSAVVTLRAEVEELVNTRPEESIKELEAEKARLEEGAKALAQAKGQIETLQILGSDKFQRLSLEKEEAEKMMAAAEELGREVERLKASASPEEVETLKVEKERLEGELKCMADLRDEVEKLRAEYQPTEVQRLTDEKAKLEEELSAVESLRHEVQELQAMCQNTSAKELREEKERLVKELEAVEQLDVEVKELYSTWQNSKAEELKEERDRLRRELESVEELADEVAKLRLECLQSEAEKLIQEKEKLSEQLAENEWLQQGGGKHESEVPSSSPRSELPKADLIVAQDPQISTNAAATSLPSHPEPKRSIEATMNLVQKIVRNGEMVCNGIFEPEPAAYAEDLQLSKSAPNATLPLQIDAVETMTSSLYPSDATSSFTYSSPDLSASPTASDPYKSLDLSPLGEFYLPQPPISPARSRNAVARLGAGDLDPEQLQLEAKIASLAQERAELTCTAAEAEALEAEVASMRARLLQLLQLRAEVRELRDMSRQTGWQAQTENLTLEKDVLLALQNSDGESVNYALVLEGVFDRLHNAEAEKQRISSKMETLSTQLKETEEKLTAYKDRHRSLKALTQVIHAVRKSGS